LENEIWSLPYRTNISKYLVRGTNSIEIKVSNLWYNRIQGETQGEVQSKNFFLLKKPNSTKPEHLKSSGIWGEVKIIKLLY
ncbi:MAG: hypothetical protein PHV35_11840, partial [Mariniphaga sp.]|nr:hypothetical protein [Mariniphaga sp.]